MVSCTCDHYITRSSQNRDQGVTKLPPAIAQASRGCYNPCIMATLKLFLLGSPHVEHGGKAIRLRRTKSLALLLYLTLNPREQSREKLATLLWPETNDSRARQDLRTALSDIRRAIGDDHLSADTEVVSFNPSNVWIDALEMEPLSLAPFLEGFNVKDAPDFDDWVSFERDRWLERFVKTLHDRAQAQEAQGEWPQAIATAKQLLELDPAHEETHRQLMRLFYATGDRKGALQAYETARAVLERELGVDPMEETRALYRQILDDAKPLAVAPPPRAHAWVDMEHTEFQLPFVGRTVERAELDRAWQAAQTRRAQFVFVEGEAGVGKTRLVEETISDWQRQAFVLRSMAHPFESNQPYRLFVDLLRDYFGTAPGRPVGIPDIWLSELSRLVPELRQARPQLPPALDLHAAQERSGLVGVTQERNRLFDAMSVFLLTLAERQPLALILDDIQWADASSLALLASLAHSLVRSRVLFLCVYRGAEANGELEHLIHTLSRAAPLTRMTVDRLTHEQVIELTRMLSHGDCASFAEWLYRESEGNPFFIRELMTYLQASSSSRDLGQLMNVLPDAPLPSSIQDLVRARVHRLSESARQLLDTAAIIGRDFDFGTLWRASGQVEDGALNALDELLRAQIIRQTASIPNPYEFSHTKVREVVLSDMSLARQQILHRRVGEALEMTQRERLRELGGTLALHFRSAGEWAKSARYARSAGDRARTILAPREAIDFYTSALESLSHLDDREATARVHMGLGETYLLLGRPERAAESYAHALATFEQLGNRERVAETRLAIVRLQFLRGEYRQVPEMAQASLSELERIEHPDARIVAQAHALWGSALAMDGRAAAEAKAHLRRALELFDQVGDPVGQCNGHFQLGNLAAQEGDLEAAVAYFEQAFADAQSGEELMWQALTANNVAYHTLLLGDIAKARRWAQRGLEIAESHQINPVLLYLYSTSAEIRLSEKKWDEAEAYLSKGMALAEQLSSPERRAGYLANLAEVAYGRGDHAAAFAQLTSAAQLSDQMGAQYASARYHLRLAEMLVEQGKVSDAQLHLKRGEQIAAEGSYQKLLEMAATIRRRAPIDRAAHDR